MGEPMAAYVGQDGLIGHHWEGSHLVLFSLDDPGYGKAWVLRQEWVDELATTVMEAGGGDTRFVEGKIGRGIMYEM